MPDISSSSIYGREDDKKESKGDHWKLSSGPNWGTGFELPAIYWKVLSPDLNHTIKHWIPALDKDSVVELKDCSF